MGLVDEDENILAGIELRRHVAELVDHRDDDAAIILAFLVQQLVERGDAVGVRDVGHADSGEILEQLIFQLIAVDHEKMVGFCASFALKSSSAALIIV